MTTTRVFITAVATVISIAMFCATVIICSNISADNNKHKRDVFNECLDKAKTSEDDFQCSLIRP